MSSSTRQKPVRQSSHQKSPSVPRRDFQRRHRTKFHRRRHSHDRRSPPAEFGATLIYQPRVIDDLSMDLGHTAGHFESVKSSMCQVYRVLIMALNRHDPLPWMVRDAIREMSLVDRKRQQQKQKQLHKDSTSHASGYQKKINDQLQFVQQRREIETITAVDIPYTLRHLEFDQHSVVDTSNTSNLAWDAIGDILVDGRLALIVRGAAACAASGGGKPVKTVATSSSASSPSLVFHSSISAEFDRRNVDDRSDSVSGSGCSSGSEPTDNDKRTFIGGTGGALKGLDSATPVSRSIFEPIDGSNSNRAKKAFHGNVVQPSKMLTAAASSKEATDFVRSGSEARSRHVFRPRKISGGRGNRICPMHHQRSRTAVSELSCAICASQHFLQHHLMRLVQESGGFGDLSRLENALSDCLRLQERWRHSVQWVANCVKDKQLPDPIRPLIQCVSSVDTGHCC